MDLDLPTLVSTAIEDLRSGQATTPPLMSLGDIALLYRHRRDGFDGQHLVDMLRIRLGSDYALPALNFESVEKCISDVYSAVGDMPPGRAYVASLIRRAEEPLLTPLLLGLLSHMWNDTAAGAAVAVGALKWASDSEEVRMVLSRWAERDDEAGDAALDVLSELTSPPRDYASVDELVEDVANAVAAGAADAAPIRALNDVLRAAARDVPGSRREAAEIRTYLRYTFGVMTASFRLHPSEIEGVLNRVTSGAPDTRRSARALVQVVTEIGTAAAVPALIATLRRIGATAISTRDRLAAGPVVRNLLPFSDRHEVQTALLPWHDLVSP